MMRMRVMWKKEDGQFGIAGTIVFFLIFLFSLIAIYEIDRSIVGMAWAGFVQYMKPDYLYPSLNGHYGRNNAMNVMLGAKYLYNNIVMRQVVNALLLLILLFVGLAYIYADLFEQFMGKLKSLLPRLVFGLILAYTSIYIFQGLMLIAKGGYVIFYNAPVMGEWKNPNYLFGVVPHIATPGNSFPYSSIPSQLENMYMGYLWVFIIMAESISLLVFVAFRIVMLGILLVLLPIASILLIHPWTQQIGSRLWWLTISLLFVPIAMIIPLMLSTMVVGSVSFMIASLTAVLGAIYLLSKEPFILGGLGFQRAGNVLTGGIIGGGASGNLLAPTSALSQTGNMAMGGIHQHALGHFGQVQTTPTGAQYVGGMGSLGFIGKQMHNLLHKTHVAEIVQSGGGSGGGGNNMGDYAQQNGGVEE